jgi:hypothetical protein
MDETPRSGGTPREGGGPPTDRSHRRTPPPDATGDEAAYLAKLRERRTVVAVQLLDGTVFRGVIEYYDRDMLKVNRIDGGGPNVFVRKKHVRCMWEEPVATTT